MGKIDYAFKGEILSSHYDELALYKKASKKTFDFYVSYQDTGVISKLMLDNNIPFLEDLEIEYAIDNRLNYFEEFKKLARAEYSRVKRLKSTIQEIIEQGAIFLTLTFNNDTLSNTNELTRRKYVRRYLKSVSSKYIANIDYGGKNGREHYHAVVLAEKVDRKNWQKFGSINFERIRLKTNTNIKLAKYVSKLTSHAIKSTNKRNVIIYSR